VSESVNLYLLDSNVLIDANRDYYSIDRVPEFWDWLEHHGEENNIKVPIEVYDEVKIGDDSLAEWTSTDAFKTALLLYEDPRKELVNRVVEEGYGPDVTDEELIKIGRDAFLVAYALVDPNSRCVVTTEVSKPNRIRANRHIPDVCRDLGAESCDTFELTRRLDFHTGWRSSV